MVVAVVLISSHPVQMVESVGLWLLLYHVWMSDCHHLRLLLRLELGLHVCLPGHYPVRTASNVCEGHATFWRPDAHKNNQILSFSRIKPIHFALSSEIVIAFLSMCAYSQLLDELVKKWNPNIWFQTGLNVAEIEIWPDQIFFSDFSSRFSDIFILKHLFKLFFTPHI